mmetsp:Transcript_21905/g.41050  ORF Transcript_21905/g.41050 Transcript_21905/m.41050 type:complete len:424 (+) Transcript_21905:589-1860(+)
MPWLEKDEVLLIHVPRCGGTSLTKHHKVVAQATKGLDLYHKVGLKYYFYRYGLLESANFPLKSFENLFVLTQITVGLIIFYYATPGLAFPYVMWGMATSTFLASTFIWTAPVLMRTRVLRRLLMFLQSKVLCGFGGDTRFLIGTNEKAYLLHLTAPRAVRFGYVTDEQMSRCAFSIVRNPYSRAVSIYEYNKRPCESFESFWRKSQVEYEKYYIKKGSTECVDIYCHLIPMFEYTHRNNQQLISTVIKQEELKSLLASDFSGSTIPDKIQAALKGVPHANSRKKSKPWQNYYNQATLDIVYSMFKRDFEVFDYPINIPTRKDISVGEPAPSAAAPESIPVRSEPSLPTPSDRKIQPASPRKELDLSTEDVEKSVIETSSLTKVAANPDSSSVKITIEQSSDEEDSNPGDVKLDQDVENQIVQT